MKKEKIELTISGIKCDTPHCNYRDDDVKFEDYYKYINKPCPVCCANLLTEECYNKSIKQYKAIEIINKALNILKWFNPFHYIRLMFGDKRKVEIIYVKK